MLDGRPVKTPARRSLAAPFRTVAEALAEEWEGQRSAIDPAAMPLTRLVNSIVDGVAAPHPGGSIEVKEHVAASTPGVFKHEVAVEQNGFNLGQERVAAVNMRPAGLHHPDLGICEVVDTAP